MGIQSIARVAQNVRRLYNRNMYKQYRLTSNFISQRGNATLVIPKDTIITFADETTEYYKGYEAQIKINGRNHVYRFPFDMVKTDRKHFEPYVAGLILPKSKSIPFGA